MAQAILEIVLKGVQDAEASVESLSAEILKQKNAQAALKKQIKDTEQAVKDGKKSQEDATKAIAGYNVQLEKSKKIQKDNTTALRQSIKIIDAQEGSLDQMRATLNKLQKEYGALDQTSQEGAMAANLLKSRIQVLDEAVKGQEESIGDHRRSVGDYGKALEGLGRYFPLLGANISAVTPFMGEFGSKLQKFTPLIGALGQNLSEGGRILNGFAESGGKATKAIGQTSEAVTAMPKGLKGLKAGFLAAKTGIVSATRAALTFMATPIGLVLTAIVAAVGAAVAAFAVANKRAEKEAEASRKKLAEEREKIEAEFRAMNRALADALIIGEAEIKVMKKGFSDAFADLNTLFDQAGKDGGAAYGDNFTSTVEASVEESKTLTTQQFESQKAAIEKQLALTEANLSEFTLNAGIVQAFGEEAAQNVARQTSPAYAQAEQSVKDYTKQLAQLEQQYKADIAEADALGQATIELSENFEESEESLAEQERRREQRRAERARRREEARRAEEARLQTLKDIVNAEVERNLTESELLEKRLNEKLKELGLDKDITKLTEQELDARNALLDKFLADQQDITDKAAEEERKKEEEAEKAEEERHQRTLDRIQEEFDARINATEQSANIEVLALETAHLDKMRLLDLTDEQRVEAERQLQLDILQVQRDSAQEQLDLLQKTVQLASVGIGQMPEGYQQTMAELSNAIAQISLEIDNISTVLPEDESLIDMLGLSEERVEKANLAMDTLSQGLNIMTQSMQVQQQNRMNAIDEQVKQGVITEEEAARKKERIQKDFARKQQKVDITQALINTALAVTSALATKPFLPMGLIAAGIATATGAAQVASIKAQKFSKGGLLSGPSHAQGGIPMFSKGGAFYGEAEGGEAVLTKGVMANPALASMASAINVAGGGVPFFANGGVLDPIQSATPTDRAADIIASGMKSRQPVLVVEQLRERENSVDVIESLRTIG
jgi:hypothetical protein